MSAQGIVITSSYVVSNAIALAFSFVRPSYQWRLQFITQTTISVMLMVVVFFLPESPRWLMVQGREAEASEILHRLHRSKVDEDGLLAQAEVAHIKAQVQADQARPHSFLSILRAPATRKRALCGLLTWMMAQVIANFAPLLFGGLGYGVTLQLCLAVAWAAACQFGTFMSPLLIDRFGRVKLMVIGGYLCSMCLIIEAVLQRFYLGTTHTAGLDAAVAFYFIYVFFYGLLIECPAYLYCVEIWPTHLRSQGATISFVSFFITTLVWNAPASLAFNNISWRYYIIMAVLAVVSATAMWWIFPETAGLTLEEIGEKFGDEVATTLDIENGESQKDEGISTHHQGKAEPEIH